MADMEKHEAFTMWALNQGVKLHGVAAHRFPGRGLGIVALEAAPVCPIFFVSFSHDHAASPAKSFLVACFLSLLSHPLPASDTSL